MRTMGTTLIACLLAVCVPWTTFAQVSPETLKQISTPDRVEIRLDTLNLFDGLPGKATVEKMLLPEGPEICQYGR
jgi:hypothetical protein